MSFFTLDRVTIDSPGVFFVRSQSPRGRRLHWSKRCIVGAANPKTATGSSVAVGGQRVLSKSADSIGVKTFANDYVYEAQDAYLHVPTAWQHRDHDITCLHEGSTKRRFITVYCIVDKQQQDDNGTIKSFSLSRIMLDEAAPNRSPLRDIAEHRSLQTCHSDSWSARMKPTLLLTLSASSRVSTAASLFSTLPCLRSRRRFSIR